MVECHRPIGALRKPREVRSAPRHDLFRVHYGLASSLTSAQDVQGEFCIIIPRVSMILAKPAEAADSSRTALMFELVA